MNAISKAKRWVPFQCPSCFGLFRLRRSQVGSVGHCPTCRTVIRVSEDGPTAAGSPVLKEVLSGEALLDRVAVAQPMTPEEVVKHEASRTSRKRHVQQGPADTIDWEEKAKVGSKSGPSWQVMGSAAMILVLVLAGAAFYVKNKAPGKGSGRSSVIGDSESQAILKEILEKDRDDVYTNEDGVDSTIESVDRYKDFDMMQVEAAVKGFLNSGTITERLKFCRDPERVRPLMVNFYDGEEIEAEGMESLNKAEVSYRDDFLTLVVRTADFLQYPIALVKIGIGEDVRYLVDWESWVGFCDLTPEEMRAGKPTTPITMRVIVSPENYYNYGFSDDKEWGAFRLELRDSTFSFLGYAKRNSEVEKALAQVQKSKKQSPFVVKVVYPPKARSQEQVEIVEILSSGWILEVNQEDDE